MYFTSFVVALVLAFVGQAVAEDPVYTSGIRGGSHPMITNAPSRPRPLPNVAGPITISVTNSFGG